LGIIVVGAVGRKRLSLLLVVLTISATLVISCGGGDDNGDDLMSYTATGLNRNTTYYWKVSATDDKGLVTTSPTRSFTVQ
jgi:hypothetical protein